ncbi:MAG: phosphatase PAP2 family protein [Brachymonas sp.]|nr:phosphatase PAP2 family protein [Brachymonas sp.]
MNNQTLPLNEHRNLSNYSLLCLVFTATSLLWDLSGLDRLVSQQLASTQGFELRHHWLPAGHASTGFCFLAAWAALQRHVRDRKFVLACIVVAGFVLGMVQVLRGAHFVSHVLWSGWICAVTGWLIPPLRKKFSHANY